jgi:RimJ/RimL family protein N-acetyltransferase
VAELEVGGAHKPWNMPHSADIPAPTCHTAAVSIRLATAADARAIAKAHIASFRWAYRGLMPADVLEALSVSEREMRWRARLEDGEREWRVWVAERDGVVVGCASTQPARDAGHPPLTAEVPALYLVEEASGAGLGRALFAHAVDDLRARGFRRLYLWVISGNQRGRHFYEAAGLRPDGGEKLDARGDFTLHEVRYARDLESDLVVVPEVRTARLRLRQWNDDDLAPLAGLSADPRVMRYFPSTLSRAESDAMAARIRRHFLERGFGVWAVERVDRTPFIGVVGLQYPHLPPPFQPEVEVAWRLSADHWGQGYATEAARAALAVGFCRLRLHDVVAMTVPANARSRAVMERIGMHQEGEFEHPDLPAGHALRRHLLYRIDRGGFARPTS